MSVPAFTSEKRLPPYYQSHKKGLTQDQILNDVVDGTLFGMVEVDIEVPEHLKSYFEEISHIFKKVVSIVVSFLFSKGSFIFSFGGIFYKKRTGNKINLPFFRDVTLHAVKIYQRCETFEVFVPNEFLFPMT